MGFYTEWKNSLDNKQASDAFLQMFLTKNSNAIVPFHEGNNDELNACFAVFHEISLETILTAIYSMSISGKFASDEIPCYSDIEIGMVRVPELLSFHEDGLTYAELGYQLRKSNGMANQKYGENQAKLAMALHLSYLISDHPRKVKNTRLGNYLLAYDLKEKKELLSALFLQDRLYQYLICQAHMGNASYKDVTQTLSVNTAMRRRQCVRQVLRFIIKGAVEEYIINEIDWTL